MNPLELARWQWADYQRFHASRFNLWLHIVAVPLFLLGNLAAIVLPILTANAVATIRSTNGEDGLGSAWALVALMALPGLVLSALAMAVQGRGHGKESHPPKPFTGVGNAFARIFMEQWVTFPRFVLSGGWLRALKATRSGTT